MENFNIETSFKENGARISGGWISVEPASQLRLKIASSLSLSPSFTSRVIKKGPGLRDSASVSASIVAFVRCVPLNS